MINVLLTLAGALIGSTFADIDLAPVLPVKHRSAWTHGPLPTALLILLISYQPSAHWFAIGFLPTFSLHLLHDMFPKRWHGAAKINMYPLRITLPALFSFAFLAVTIFYSIHQFLNLIVM